MPPENPAPQNEPRLTWESIQPHRREFFRDLGIVLGFGARPPRSWRYLVPARIYKEVNAGGRPGRGLLYSFLVHEIALFLILLLPLKFRPERHVLMVEQWLKPEDTQLIYPLPAIGGGHEGGGPKGGGSPAKTQEPEGGKSAPAPAPAGGGGLVYPSAQPVVSNPPNPTNRIQTILQPELVKPPQLKVPRALPNLVRLAPLPPPPMQVPKVQVSQPQPVPPSEPSLRGALHSRNLPYHMPVVTPPPPNVVPKLTLPPTTTAPEPQSSFAPPQAKLASLPSEHLPAPPMQVPKVSEAQTALPSPQQPRLSASLGGASGTDAHSLLVLSPVPGPPQDNPQVPPGEARGKFAMGPNANLTGSPDAPPGPLGPGGAGPGGSGKGTGTGAGAVGAAGGTGHGTGAGTGTGTGPGAGGEGTGKGAGHGAGGGGGQGGSVGPGTGSGIGPGVGGTGKGGVGTGTGSGRGPGAGQGTGSGAGTGAGTGAGSGPFPGISIVGGTETSGASTPAAAAKPKPKPAAPQTYGMTVVATSESGGGLRDYGIFRNETVYTVYIEMTHSPEPAPSWILQFAPEAAPGDPHGEVTAPFPKEKPHPKFPPEIVARNEGRLIVVTCLIDAEGKVEKPRIIQSPNPLLNPPLLEALTQWVFQPAVADGKPVAVRALFGIPLSLPH